MKISLPLLKSKAKNTTKSTKKQQVRREPHVGNYAGGGIYVRPGGSTRAFAKGHRNNLQALYKRKSMFNYKARKRKFKSRVTNASPIRSTSKGLLYPRRPHHVGFKVNRGFRVPFATFIGIEKTVLNTGGKLRIKFRKYPDYFITKKSSKSRMGKGKGKIFGRILKIRPGEIFFDFKVKNPLKTRRFVKAIKEALPARSRLVYRNKWAARIIANFYRRRVSRCYREKKKKKKFWQLKLEKTGPTEVDIMTKSVAFSDRFFAFRKMYFR